MTYRQLISPKPNIPCKPGWCLAYVNEAYGVPKVYPSATAAWYGSQTKHEDRNFPAGVAIPVFYGLDTTPLGHVVIRMPDGSVYSTSDLTNIPHHHPDLADLERYYAYYGMNLTYRGWTEDVEGTPVVTEGRIYPQGMAAMTSTTTELQQEEPLKLDQEDLNAVSVVVRDWGTFAAQQALTAPIIDWGDYKMSVAQQTAENAKGLQALTGIVRELAAGQGIDQAKVDAAIKAALSGVSATITIGDKPNG